jgi:hypothetical protein
MLANLPWRQLRVRAEKIPGDQKHDYELRWIFSHTKCIAQFNTAQKRPSERAAANVQDGAVSRMGVVAFCPNEK